MAVDVELTNRCFAKGLCKVGARSWSIPMEVLTQSKLLRQKFGQVKHDLTQIYPHADLEAAGPGRTQSDPEVLSRGPN